jgi:dTDP-4-dehydrorhamnose 3,5-epimerase
VLSETVEFVYKVTAEYDPETYRGIVWNDPEIGIEWPIAEPMLSERDVQLPPLKEADNNFVYQT